MLKAAKNFPMSVKSGMVFRVNRNFVYSWQCKKIAHSLAAQGFLKQSGKKGQGQNGEAIQKPSKI